MSVELGPFAVSATAADVAALCGAAQLEANGDVPFTFPIRWLARPEIRGALVALTPEPGLVPFHESQTFEFASPLQAGVSYVMDVAARREHAPERIVVDARLAAADAALVAKVETVLRLFPTGQEAA